MTTAKPSQPSRKESQKIMMNTLHIRCQKSRLLEKNGINKLIKFCLIILSVNYVNFVNAQLMEWHNDDDFVYDFDSVVPIFSTNDVLLEAALDSFDSFWKRTDSVPKQWDLFLSKKDTDGICIYISKPFFPTMHKIGYGVLKYKDYSFVISGIWYSGFIETSDVVNVCFCSSYPICTWDPPSALFIRETEKIYCAYIRK